MHALQHLAELGAAPPEQQCRDDQGERDEDAPGEDAVLVQRGSERWEEEKHSEQHGCCQ
ncbi:hypothetical protein [Microbacterium aurum]